MTTKHDTRRIHRQAFTLIEALLVCGIITLLIGLIMPAVQQARAAADKIVCQNSLRQIAHAVHLYHNDFQRVPRPRIDILKLFSDPNQMLSILTHLTPYVEAQQIMPDGIVACRTGVRPWISPPHTHLNTVVRLYGCPADERLDRPMVDIAGRSAAYASYVPCRGGSKLYNGFFGRDGEYTGLKLTDIRDGLSNTIMIGERPPPDSLQAGRWYPAQTPYSPLWGNYQPGPDNSMATFNPLHAGDPCDGIYGLYRYGVTSNPCHRYHFWSLHPGGANFAMGDASIRFIKYAIRQDILDALGSRAGGEAITEDVD